MTETNINQDTKKKAINKKNERVQFERIIRKPGQPEEKKIFTYRREIAERLITKGLGRIVKIIIETEAHEDVGGEKSSGEDTWNGPGKAKDTGKAKAKDTGKAKAKDTGKDKGNPGPSVL